MDLYSVYHLFYRNIIMSSLQYPHVTKSLVHCSALCSMASNCSSFFYNNVNHDCYLVGRFVLPGGSGREPRINIAYYVSDVPPCESFLGFQAEPSLNICYKVHLEKLNFTSGRAVCQGEGGDLATAKTAQIEAFYIAHLKTYEQDMFFSATEVGSSGNWKWVDGSLCWRTYRQSESDKQCLECDYDDERIDGEKCGNDQGFVCEIVLPRKLE